MLIVDDHNHDVDGEFHRTAWEEIATAVGPLADGDQRTHALLSLERLGEGDDLVADAAGPGAAATTASVSVTGSATDPDAENVTLSQTNNAPFFTASSSATTGTFAVTVTGTSGSTSRSTSISLTVSAGGGPVTVFYDGAESASLRQGSPAHLDWVASRIEQDDAY